MSENELPRITLKGGTGYDAPWLTLPFSDVESAKAHLRAIREGGLLEEISATAQLFTGVHAAGPITQPPAQEPQQQSGAAWGTIAPGGFQPAQQGQQWNQPPQQQVTNGPPQGSHPGATLHPEGEKCSCGKTLEYGKTRTNKGQWKCPDYRWNNGNPNEHRLEWA